MRAGQAVVLQVQNRRRTRARRGEENGSRTAGLLCGMLDEHDLPLVLLNVQDSEKEGEGIRKAARGHQRNGFLALFCFEDGPVLTWQQRTGRRRFAVVCRAGRARQMTRWPTTRSGWCYSLLPAGARDRYRRLRHFHVSHRSWWTCVAVVGSIFAERARDHADRDLAKGCQAMQPR